MTKLFDLHCPINIVPLKLVTDLKLGLQQLALADPLDYGGYGKCTELQLTVLESSRCVILHLYTILCLHALNYHSLW